MKLSISLFIFIAIALGLIFPQGVLLKEFTIPLLFVLMYFSAMDFRLNKKRFFRKEVFLWGAVNIFILPLLAYFFGSFLSSYLLLGVVAAALAPTATSSPIFVKLVNGDEELSISISAIANFSSIFYIPIMLFLLFGLKLSIPYDQILINIVGLVFLPIILAAFTKKILKSKTTKIVNFSKRIVPPLLLIIVWVVFSMSASQILLSLNEVMTVIPVIFLISGVGFLLGYAFVKEKSLKRTLAISCCFKNITLVLGVFYGFNPIVFIPPTLYIIFHHFFNGIAIWLYEKKKI